MASGSTVAALENVRRCLGGRVIIEDLSATIRPGEVVGLRGGNGTGKTTLLRCVAGVAPVDGGSILVGGHGAYTEGARRQIGSVLGVGRALYWRLTGHENLLLFARLRLRGADATRAVKAVEAELELGEFAGQRTEDYSAGMLGQVLLARALIGARALLVLDEPTRSLDVAARGRMWAAIRRRPGLSVMIASHREEDLDHADRVIELPR